MGCGESSDASVKSPGETRVSDYEEVVTLVSDERVKPKTKAAPTAKVTSRAKSSAAGTYQQIDQHSSQLLGKGRKKHWVRQTSKDSSASSGSRATRMRTHRTQAEIDTQAEAMIERQKAAFERQWSSEGSEWSDPDENEESQRQVSGSSQSSSVAQPKAKGKSRSKKAKGQSRGIVSLGEAKGKSESRKAKDQGRDVVRLSNVQAPKAANDTVEAEDAQAGLKAVEAEAAEVSKEPTGVRFRPSSSRKSWKDAGPDNPGREAGPEKSPLPKHGANTTAGSSNKPEPATLGKVTQYTSL